MNRQILKSLLFVYSWVLLFFFGAALSVWEYKRWGYIVAKGYPFYGEEARTMILFTVVASVMAFVWCSYWTIRKLRNPEERQRYLEGIRRSKFFICPRCCEPFRPLASEQEPTCCPKCGGTDVEELSGFFKRHPEKKGQCPRKEVLNPSGKEFTSYRIIFGIIFGALVVAAVIVMLVMGLLWRVGILE
jgi:hypothetical protein